MKIILASASPRRSELLRQAGLEFEVIPSQVEEKMEGEKPSDVVMFLARQKAEDVFQKIYSQKVPERGCGDFIVLGADTIVVCDGRRLGKPVNEDDAFSMLKLLSGRRHEVYTGVFMKQYRGGEVSSEAFFECTKVDMYPISDACARWYVGTGEPMDKAGAYGIQGIGAVLIRGIEGDYNNVVGLPIARVWHMIGQCEDV
ncbi:MAG: septum formation protein Maf [Clostridiales bacterium]|nr:septum formation protein Maf [Clostridiales bacterium]